MTVPHTQNPKPEQNDERIMISLALTKHAQFKQFVDFISKMPTTEHSKPKTFNNRPIDNVIFKRRICNAKLRPFSVESFKSIMSIGATIMPTYEMDTFRWLDHWKTTIEWWKKQHRRKTFKLPTKILNNENYYCLTPKCVSFWLRLTWWIDANDNLPSGVREFYSIFVEHSNEQWIRLKTID